MATLFTAARSFLEETRDRIVDIVPEYEPQKRFQPRSDAEIARGEMRKALKAPRMFEISAGNDIGHWYTGAAYFGHAYKYNIMVWYPTTSGALWHIAADSDFAKIRNDIMTSSSSVSGVQQRWIEKDVGTEIELIDDDPWFIKTLPMLVVYEYTG